MTTEKICPIMSRPIMMTKYCDMGDNMHSEEIEAMFKEVFCQKEKCMAWQPPTTCEYFDECNTAEDKRHFKDFRKRCQEINGTGKCRESAFCKFIGRVKA